ncbi:MAG TPA: SLBB domain-containing protein [Steroidobacteraceae bacterium]|nr:SLBB domain-containing protein [Steroidobacteraceae bacterium]
MAGSRPTPLSEEQENLLLQQQREQLLEQQTQRTELQRLSPFLQNEDWVVITIDSVPLPGPSAPVPSAPPQSVLGALGGAPAATPSSPQVNPLANPALALAAQNAAQTQQSEVATQSQVAAATAAAMAAPTGQTVTAGGYSPEQNCSGMPNCDTTQPPAPELTAEQRMRQRAMIDLIRAKNPYQLSRDGMLSLPGFAPIPLAGLTEQLATLRLGVEPALRDLFIRVTKLPLLKSGTSALKPFGYDLFEHPVSTFAPTTNVPVPAGYIVGPGDELEVQLYGSKNANLKLTVGRDGRVNMPQIGPVAVGGQTFADAKEQLESSVSRQMVGVRASVTMGDTRTIRVFVLGAVKTPGSYTVSGLGTITSALFAAGGVQHIGSLRDIQLKRRGEIVRRLDLYDLLIHGNTTDDARLLPDDAVFVPAIGPTVTVDGEVHRPAIYEIRRENSVAEVIALAGGLTPEADTDKAALTRIDANLHRVVLQVDLTADAGRAANVRNGDSLHVARLRPTLDAGVVVQGYVYTSGAFAYRSGMRLTDIIRSVDDLKPNADLHYILIRRELAPDRRIAVLSADLDAALRQPGSAADVPLMARDRITVFDLQSSRDRVIRPLIEDLREQSNISRPEEVVRINGRANVPGEYPLETNMTVRDLIRAGGGLSDAAYGGTAELTRYRVVNGDSRQTDLIKVDLAAVMRADPAANIRLEPFDVLSIKEVESWTDQETMIIRGQVKFPGVYSVKPGETLKSAMLRAGGLTQYAFPEGSVFIRRELREREQRELDQLANRMQNDIAFVALEGSVANQAGAASALTVGQSLLTQLRQAKAVGRLVINLPRLMQSPAGSQYDVVLRDGDELIVPKQRQEVTVIGEVQAVSSHLWRSGLTRNDYIAMSGGETRRADPGRIYVVRADGSVVPNAGSRWFRTANEEIKPGDTVVVPLNAEHIPALPFWAAVTQIIYNVAVAFLAVHSAI